MFAESGNFLQNLRLVWFRWWGARFLRLNRLSGHFVVVRLVRVGNFLDGSRSRFFQFGKFLRISLFLSLSRWCSRFRSCLRLSLFRQFENFPGNFLRFLLEIFLLHWVILRLSFRSVSLSRALSALSFRLRCEFRVVFRCARGFWFLRKCPFVDFSPSGSWYS